MADTDLGVGVLTPLDCTPISAGEKKARLASRADKGLEIFFVNEKVRFEKQNFQYSVWF
jgi:hypothetical protein